MLYCVVGSGCLVIRGSCVCVTYSIVCVTYSIDGEGQWVKQGLVIKFWGVGSCQDL